MPNLSKDSEASWQLPKRYLDAVGSSFVPFVADGIAIETQLQQQPQPPRQEYPYFNRSQYIRGPSVMDVTPFNERVSKLMRSQLAIALRDGAQLHVSNNRSELGSWGRALMDTAGILGVSVSNSSVNDATVAFGNLLLAVEVELPRSMTDYNDTQVASIDDWMPAMRTLTNAAWESQLLALLIHDQIVGNVTHTEFYGLTTINAFRNRIRSPQHRPTADGSGLTLACLSETANTYSPTAHLHQESHPLL